MGGGATDYPKRQSLRLHDSPRRHRDGAGSLPGDDAVEQCPDARVALVRYPRREPLLVDEARHAGASTTGEKLTHAGHGGHALGPDKLRRVGASGEAHLEASPDVDD